MTLEHLVVYGGIVLGIWLLGVITFLALGDHRRSVLHLDGRHPAQGSPEAPERRSWAGRLRHVSAHR